MLCSLRTDHAFLLLAINMPAIAVVTYFGIDVNRRAADDAFAFMLAGAAVILLAVRSSLGPDPFVPAILGSIEPSEEHQGNAGRQSQTAASPLRSGLSS